MAAFKRKVRIDVLHVRGRLVDPDNLSVKAVIDGLVRAGVLRDDSPKEVEEVRHRQVKGKPERTEITLTEV